MKEDTLEDRLERFVKLNRSQFDDQQPREVVWDGINERLEVKPEAKVRQLVWWRAAAVLFFVFTIGLLLKDSFITTTNTEVVGDVFMQTESYYTAQISDKEQLIEIYLVDYPGLSVEFKSDIEQLDNMYLQLKEEYKVNNSEVVLDALIMNLQSRIDLLNRQLNVIKSINQKDDEINI